MLDAIGQAGGFTDRANKSEVLVLRGEGPNTQRYVVERYYRDAKIWSYAQGSPEVMSEIIARDLMKRKVEEPLI